MLSNEPTSSLPDADGNSQTRVYKKRYLMLIMFIILSASNALQWIEYSIIAHIITDFYGVSYDDVNWTSMIYMLTYTILVFPGSWFLDKYGLRTSLLIGAFGNCFGAWLKLLSTHPDKFWLTFMAQTIVGSSQVFILGIPPRLAAVWFGPEQVSTACAAGVFGNQLGIAIGFVLPPWLVHEGTKDSIAYDLSLLFLISGVLNTAILILVVLFFKERPPLPPSLAQVRAIEEAGDSDFIGSLKQLCTNVNYLLLLLTYALNVGVFYAVSTLLSQMVLHYHPNAQEETGTIGLLIVVAGMLGSVVCGYILDRFHHFKGTTLVVYILSFAGMILFTFTLQMDLWIIFFASGSLGFFMTGYLPIGFEFAAELTFPIAEGTTSGLLNGAVQVIGVLMTLWMGKLMYSIGIFYSNLIMCGFLFIGVIVTATIRSDLRRQKAQSQKRELTSHSNTELTDP
ncbi:MFS domain-containing protein [Aphelenchoides besseyi]|nr:MFS domain-containing protein [Aphelenchoides besseyi]KAI6208025.1 MFS domain-containing protein [Aphelenchoides besseyi]